MNRFSALEWLNKSAKAGYRPANDLILAMEIQGWLEFAKVLKALSDEFQRQDNRR